MKYLITYENYGETQGAKIESENNDKNSKVAKLRRKKVELDKELEEDDDYFDIKDINVDSYIIPSSDESEE